MSEVRFKILRFLFAVLLAKSIPFGLQAQKFSCDAQIGVGYIERFSLGAAVTRNNSSTFALTYGSNMFLSTHKFSSLFVGYSHLLKRDYTGIRFGLNLKAGHTQFEDRYYRWRVITVVPAIALQKALTRNTAVGVDAGLAVSKIRSVVRLDYGEIGRYRRYLPEIQFFYRHKIFRSRD